MIHLENNVCYSVDELFKKIEEITPIQNQQKKYLQERIDEHFNMVLKTILEFKQKKTTEINEVADCIFDNCENQQIQRIKIMQLQEEISKKQKEIEVIDKECHDYKIKYEQTVNSIYWKIMRPFRTIIGVLRTLKSK